MYHPVIISEEKFCYSKSKVIEAYKSFLDNTSTLTYQDFFRENIGFPIVDCKPDGSFAVTKPPKTGGLINKSVIAEQVVNNLFFYLLNSFVNHYLPNFTVVFPFLDFYSNFYFRFVMK